MELIVATHQSADELAQGELHEIRDTCFDERGICADVPRPALDARVFGLKIVGSVLGNGILLVWKYGMGWRSKLTAPAVNCVRRKVKRVSVHLSLPPVPASAGAPDASGGESSSRLEVSRALRCPCCSLRNISVLEVNRAHQEFTARCDESAKAFEVPRERVNRSKKRWNRSGVDNGEADDSYGSKSDIGGEEHYE
jgi:hypothetical protein